MTGALLVDKPSGPTSHDVVAFTRRLLRTSRVGHTGTLDPLATGLLVLLIGPATRLARFLAADEKEYVADVRLGVSTPTYDAASLSDVRGPTSDVRRPTDAELEQALSRFRGTFLQLPPPFSAKKVAGTRAYAMARNNEPVELRPVPVTVRELRVLPLSDLGRRTSDVGPDLGHRASAAGRRTSDLGSEAATLLRLRVVASAGFYVRSLAHDLGRALGCGAYLESLRRTRAGQFRVEDAAALEILEAEGPAAAGRLVSTNTLLAHLPAVTPTAEGLRRATNGNPLAPAHLEKGGCPLFHERSFGFPPESAGFRRAISDLAPEKGTAPLFRVLDASGEVRAVAEGRGDGLLHPLVVLR